MVFCIGFYFFVGFFCVDFNFFIIRYAVCFFVLSILHKINTLNTISEKRRWLTCCCYIFLGDFEVC